LFTFWLNGPALVKLFFCLIRLINALFFRAASDLFIFWQLAARIVHFSLTNSA